MIAQLTLTYRQVQAMRRHVRRRAPAEACGLLAGRGERVELVVGMRNAARSSTRFRMAPREQWKAFCRIEARGLELLGIYHSHPAGPPVPSPTDISEAMYPVVHVIWCPVGDQWQARGFWIESGQVTEVRLEFLNPE